MLLQAQGPDVPRRSVARDVRAFTSPKPVAHAAAAGPAPRAHAHAHTHIYVASAFLAKGIAIKHLIMQWLIMYVFYRLAS